MRRFYDDHDHMISVQPALGHMVASLDKTLYDDYLFLVASYKQKFTREEVKRQPKSIQYVQFLSGRGRFVQNKSSTAASS